MNGKSINTIKTPKKIRKQNNQPPKKHIKVFFLECVKYQKLGYSHNLPSTIYILLVMIIEIHHTKHLNVTYKRNICNIS
jgi:hypothetical protein